MRASISSLDILLVEVVQFCKRQVGLIVWVVGLRHLAARLVFITQWILQVSVNYLRFAYLLVPIIAQNETLRARIVRIHSVNVLYIAFYLRKVSFFKNSVLLQEGTRAHVPQNQLGYTLQGVVFITRKSVNLIIFLLMDANEDIRCEFLIENLCLPNQSPLSNIKGIIFVAASLDIAHGRARSVITRRLLVPLRGPSSRA